MTIVTFVPLVSLTKEGSPSPYVELFLNNAFPIEYTWFKVCSYSTDRWTLCQQSLLTAFGGDEFCPSHAMHYTKKLRICFDL